RAVRIPLSFRVSFWDLGSAGCQPAVAGSLPATNPMRSRLDEFSEQSRQAAETCRLAACAPRTRLFRRDAETNAQDACATRTHLSCRAKSRHLSLFKVRDSSTRLGMTN